MNEGTTVEKTMVAHVYDGMSDIPLDTEHLNPSNGKTVAEQLQALCTKHGVTYQPDRVVLHEGNLSIRLTPLA